MWEGWSFRNKLSIVILKGSTVFHTIFAQAIQAAFEVMCESEDMINSTREVRSRQILYYNNKAGIWWFSPRPSSYSHQLSFPFPHDATAKLQLVIDDLEAKL